MCQWNTHITFEQTKKRSPRISYVGVCVHLRVEESRGRERQRQRDWGRDEITVAPLQFEELYRYYDNRFPIRIISTKGVAFGI